MSGVLHGVLASLKAAAAAVTDAFFEYVSLLLNTSATNGAQNNTFLDGSANNFSITRNGNTTQGTFSPFSQTGWSNFFDGTGDYLTTATSGTATGNFTYEAWVYQTAATTGIVITNGSEAADRVYMYVTSGQQLGWGIYFVSDYTLGGSIPLNQWNHIALVRVGTTVTGYVNGVATGTTTTYSGTAGNANGFAVGAGRSGASPFTGYISNARVVNGTAVYTSNFTPPTAPLTAITNTSLLTCQSNRFIDNSSNAFAITRNGDVSVQAFSPFNPTAAWSASTNGGSGYFDGAGDYLSIANNTAFDFGSGDFTVECWVYPIALGQSAFSRIYAKPNASSYSGVAIIQVASTYDVNIYSSSNGTSWNLSTGAIGTMRPFAWNHLAVTRSGTNMYGFLNGVLGSTTNVSTTALYASTDPVTIGSQNGVANTFFTGYVGDVRVLKGTAQYTAAFTPPTAPLTAIANTSLLLNFTNAGIYDSASGNDLETVGNAQVSTTQAKWGTTSMAFDGTGDWLLLPSKPSLQLRNADFTIECWVYPTTLNGNSGTAYGIFTQWSASYGLYVDGAGNVVFAYNTGTPASFVFSASGIAVNTWKFVAVTRSGTSVRCFVDGVQVGTTQTLSGSLTNSANSFYVGADQIGVSNVPFIGYIDDLRITNGYARYGFFTPPTTALTPTAYTGLLANTTTTNGAQNNTFLDGSTNNFSITRNGNTTQGTFSPFSNSGWSNYFDGNGDYFTVANNAALNMGASNFTLEAFIYLTATPGAANPYGGVIIDKDGLSGTSWPQYALSVDSNRKAVFQASSVPNVISPTAVITGATTLALGTWYHIAVTRVGTAATLWVNGVSDGTTSSVPATLNSATRSLFIGWADRGTPDSAYNFPGYISNLRIVKGTAVYTTAFTPPTAPLTAITNTSLLTCQSNRFIDNSTNNFTITRNGDTSIQAFSPFTPAAYSTSTNGGSGYFDGTGDYLSVAHNAALNLSSGDFTIEAFVYWSGSNANSTIIDKDGTAGSSYPQYDISLNGSGFVVCYVGSGNGTSSIQSITSNTALPANTWAHLAFVKSGTTLTLYQNGTSVASATQTATMTDGAKAVLVGYQTGVASTYYFNGYISNLRIVKGTAVYTANFTPPTAPLTAITNTSLLLNFTNAGIYDAAGANNFETVGDAQVSTTQAKFGTTSMSFDGTGDLVVTPSNVSANLSTGNFTIEFWFNANSLVVTGALVAKMNYSAPNWTGYGLFQVNQTIVFYHANGGAINNISTGNVITATGTWYHVAVVKSGTATNNTTIFINGVQQAQGTPTIGNVTRPLTIGGSSATYGWDTDRFINGYIDDLRITNGQALYTLNFTPPTAAFPLQ